MRKLYYLAISQLSFLLLFSGIALSQDLEGFTTDVETELKPWTDLDFYNDPYNFQFALVGDNTGGSRLGIFDKGVEKLNMMMPEFVLSVGDLIQGYTTDTSRISEEWEEFNQKVDKLQMPFFYLPGNHDITNQVMQKEWEDRYGRRYYYFTYKDVLFIILDSNDDDDHNISETQREFVLDALDSHSDARWTFVLMHHPIWKYNTNGRFGEIEASLKDRKHTVIAGHEHTYQHIERNETNYYVLATTGGSSALRGNRFGQFDHIVWVTMKDSGPMMANLRLDGILPHDVSNSQTRKLAAAMLENTRFDYQLLTNKGERFSDGTAYLYFKNSANVTLDVELSFYHHHEVDIVPAQQKIKLEAGENRVVEIALKAHEQMKLDDLGLLKYYWKIGYEGKQYEDFYLDGNADLIIEPSQPDFFLPMTRQFIETSEVSFRHPFSELKTNMSIDGNEELLSTRKKSIALEASAVLEAYLVNDKNQVSATITKAYEKVQMMKGKKVRRAVPGLHFGYYEGQWKGLPNFSELPCKKEGISQDFSVGDLAIRRDYFGMRFNGYIEVPEDGLYHFQIRADDAGSLKIHDQLVCQVGIDLHKDPEISDQGAIALKAGLHPVEIDFKEIQGGERLRLYYRKSEGANWIFMELADFFKTTDRNK